VPIAIYVLATGVIWAVSGGLAVGLGLLLVAFSISSSAARRRTGGLVITLTRGLPTSLLVVAGGVTAARLPAQRWLPNIFPGTPDGMQAVAWAVTVALALGSAGHLAVIFQTSLAALGRCRIEQTTVLGISQLQRLGLLAREAALTALAPTSARLVHHLHNTAFAALFPIVDLFGWVQERASATFDVTSYALIGAGIYVAMSGCIWAAGRSLERWLTIGSRSKLRSLHVPVA
jgi:ABC-type arginine/histidine transport system permease subunit